MCALRTCRDGTMEEVLLSRTGKVPLKFMGELVAYANGLELKGDWDKRWHEIAIYRTQKGRWVVSINYRANEKYRKEPPYDRVEVFDDPDALAQFLEDYNSTLNMLGYPPKPQYEEYQRQEFIKTKNQWGALVADVLRQAGISESID